MKKIIVCVKQVPNTSNVKLDPKYHTLIREGIASIINPHDESAIAAALECKHKYGSKVAVLTMGPPQAKEVLNYCMEMGADEAFLLTDERLAGSDTLATSMAISKLIKKLDYENVFCGQESADSSTGHIGPSLAEFLKLPQVTYADKIIKIIGNKVRIRTEYESGYKLIDVKLPVVISFNKKPVVKRPKIKKINNGRINLVNLDYISIDPGKVGIGGSPTRVVDIDIDEDSLNFLIVDSILSAEERIRLILTGGIVKKKNRVMFKTNSKSAIDIVAKEVQLIKK